MTLVRANDGRLRKICRAYAQDPDSQSDLYHDILVQLWRALPSFAAEAQSSTWLYRVALNTALSRKRAGLARREADHDRLDASHAHVHDRSPTPAEHLEAQQQLARLYAAIDQLAEVDKTLITLFLEERSNGEIAQVLGISANNVAVRLHRAKKALAAALEENDS